jgi:hypothetical protein
LLPITPAPITPTRKARSTPALERTADGAEDGIEDVLETIYPNPESIVAKRSPTRVVGSPSTSSQLWRMLKIEDETRFNSENYDCRRARSEQLVHDLAQNQPPPRPIRRTPTAVQNNTQER